MPLVIVSFVVACGGSTPGDDLPTETGAGAGGGGAAGAATGAAATGGDGGIGGSASGGTSSSTASGMQVLHEAESDPSSIALDDRFIYWTSRGGLRQAPLGGGAPVTLVAGEYVRSIATSGEYVYFTQSSFGTGRVARVARTGGEPQPIEEGVAPDAIAVAGEHVFWADPGLSLDTGQLFRATLDGSEVVLLAAGLPSPAGLVLDAEFIYFSGSSQSCGVTSAGASCTGGGIHRVPLAGGPAEEVLASSAPLGIALGSRGIYWFEGPPPFLMHAEPFGTPRPVADVLAHGTGQLVADDAALYWPSGDKVLRLPFEGEVVTRLATNLDGASGVAVRGDWAYVAESSAGRILRVATDGSANRPDAPITGPCPEPIGSVEELAATPRADVNLEQLALSLEPGNVTASQDTYERVLADVAAIRALAPERADIGYRAPHDGKTIYLGLTELAAQSLSAGEYSAWDCLNERYDASPGELRESLGGDFSLLLALRGIYDITLVAQRYAELPGVTAAEANLFAGDGSTLCAVREGDRYRYLVDRAGGDCPAGCTEHDVVGFESEAAGQITALGAWASTSGEPSPAWARICR